MIVGLPADVVVMQKQYNIKRRRKPSVSGEDSLGDTILMLPLVRQCMGTAI